MLEGIGVDDLPDIGEEDDLAGGVGQGGVERGGLPATGDAEEANPAAGAFFDDGFGAVRSVDPSETTMISSRSAG